MSQSLWSAMDAYLVGELLPDDAALQAALEANREAGLPSIDVSPLQGRLLHLMAKMAGAKRILEIGTLGGYSTIWLARALPPDGRLVTLEIDPKHARVAAQNLRRAGLSDRVEQIIGPARDSLAMLESRATAPFDFVFIDADKPGNPAYLAVSLALSRPGTVIVVDNVVREGRVLDATSSDPAVLGVRELMTLVRNEPRLEATALQVVGAKGHDGLLVARVGAALPGWPNDIGPGSCRRQGARRLLRVRSIPWDQKGPGRSDLGRLVARDFHADADFGHARGGPGHGGSPCKGSVVLPVLIVRATPIRRGPHRLA
jgi:predicted O-methyltransferase YrrM